MKIYKLQRGVSLVLVLFILAVVATLVISISNLSGTQHVNSSYSFRNSQAYFAARSGVDYAIARITAGAGCAGVAPGLVLADYNITITCAVSGTYNEGDLTAVYSVFSLSALASRGGFQIPDVSNRQVRATLKFP